MDPLQQSQSNEMDYVIEPLNTLSFPKGHAPKCDLTGGPATCKLISSHITLHYATREHAEQAWHGIVHKIAHLLGPLKSGSAAVGSHEDRAKRLYATNLSKRALIDLCQQEASRMLVNQRYSLAIPGAVQALAFLKDIFGEESIESVPPYLLLAEANLGMAKFQQCEEFLSLANWSILKNPNTSHAIHSQLHRNFGKLYSAQGKLDDAVKELAKDVYHSSLCVGPEHVDTSPGYYHLGNIFYAQGRVADALAFYDKVVDVWYKFLALVRNDDDLASTFTDPQLREGVDMLERIMTTRISLLGDQHIATGEVMYTVGLLHLFLGDRERALSLVGTSADIYADKLGGQHPSTMDVRGVADQLRSDVAAAQRNAQSGGGRFDTADGRATSGGGAMLEGGGGVTIGIVSGGVSQMDGFNELINQFPQDMPRAATQSPIPLPPGSRQSYGGVDDSMRMTPSGSRGRVTK